MKTSHSYQLTSEHRKVPIMAYANGLEFPWETLVADIEKGTFDPQRYDMLHALNWMKRHLTRHQHAGQNAQETQAASFSFCQLYPHAPEKVQAHMQMILHSACFQHNERMKTNPNLWLEMTALAWNRQENTSMWSTMFKKIGAPIKELPLTTNRLSTAVLLLSAHVQSWLSSPFSRSASDMMYDALHTIAQPALQGHLQTYRLLYPEMASMPKAQTRGDTFSLVDTSVASGSHVYLAQMQQWADNLTLLHETTVSATAQMSIDLPEDSIELRP